jgi:1-acyl-sn-glycerol-3-phosphate acyltransferase
MSEHLTESFSDKLAKNKKIVFSEQKFNTKRNFTGRLWYFWSMLVVAFMVLLIAPPILLVLGLINRREWFYPFARWGARWWLRLSGARIVMKGLEDLEPNKAYVFASNHRSYLDTAAMFAHTGKKMGLVAKKELLKVPVFGYGMQYVNILPIDRSNPERASQTLEAVRQKIADGVSFAIFAEGTRALPAELLPFKRGAFSVAIETQTPIVPVAVKNSDYLMGKKTGVAYPGTIEIVFLPPIETAGLTVENDMETLRDKTRALVAGELAK